MTETMDQLLAYEVMAMLEQPVRELSEADATRFVESWTIAGQMLAFIHNLASNNLNACHIYTTQSVNDEDGEWAVAELMPSGIESYCVSVAFNEHCWPRSILLAGLECIRNNRKSARTDQFRALKAAS